MHAKNISINTWLNPGQLGTTPTLHTVAYTPLYDLVNTRIYIPGDRFAITVNGKNDNLKIKDFAAVSARWGLGKTAVSDIAGEIANGIRTELQSVLKLSGLTAEEQTNYSSVVDTNTTGMRL